MADYKELLDYDIKKKIRKVVKRYYSNEYAEIKYLNPDVKEKIKLDLINELSLTEEQAVFIVEGKIQNNYRFNLLRLAGLGYKSDYFAIDSFCNGLKKLILKHLILPFSIIFIPLIFIWIVVLLCEFQTEILIVLIVFLFLYLFMLLFIYLLYKPIFIKKDHLINDILVNDEINIYKLKFILTPSFAINYLHNLFTFFSNDICLLVLFYKDSNGKKQKLLYIPTNIGNCDAKFVRNYFKTLNKKIKVQYYQSTRFLISSSIDFEKQIKRIQKK